MAPAGVDARRDADGGAVVACSTSRIALLVTRNRYPIGTAIAAATRHLSSGSSKRLELSQGSRENATRNASGSGGERCPA
jgi:hypothetical protein